MYLLGTKIATIKSLMVAIVAIYYFGTATFPFAFSAKVGMG